MLKEKTAESLAEKLQEYAYEAEEGGHDNFFDDYIVDELLDMREHLFKDDVEEGRFYQKYYLETDKMIKLYEVVSLKKALSGDTVNLKVMSIDSVNLGKNGTMLVEFLGRIVK